MPRLSERAVTGLEQLDQRRTTHAQRDAVSQRARRKVKRAAAVLAAIERLPEVDIARRLSLTLRLHNKN